MFSGIIHALARVVAVEDRPGGCALAVEKDAICHHSLGDSIAIQGVCLTLTTLNSYAWFDVSAATLEVTNLHQLTPGAWVNLEPAMRMGDSIDGHLVTGHVDATGCITAITAKGDNHQVCIDFDAKLRPFIASKGSICVDGVSLTVNQVTDTQFGVNIVPFTWDHTCFPYYKTGDKTNLEIDPIARYLVNALNYRHLL